jgi:hypothetical protein
MANSILQMIGNRNSSPNLSSQAQQMIQNNDPAMIQAVNYVKQNGGDPKTALLKLMNERGISPDAIRSRFGIGV